MDLNALSEQIKASLHDTARLIETMQSAMPSAAPISAPSPATTYEESLRL
jgi:hypothetical protein